MYHTLFNICSRLLSVAMPGILRHRYPGYLPCFSRCTLQPAALCLAVLVSVDRIECLSYPLFH